MAKRYIFLALILLLAAFGLTRLPDRLDDFQISPEDLLVRINDPAKFQTPHQIAKRLIERDPSLFLVDVRNVEQYEDYSLPGAVNISGDVITAPEWFDYINQEGMDIVFYSNGDVYADQAWMLFAQQGVEQIYVLKGGMNEWFKTIIQPIPPDESAPSEAFDQYAFELAASIYFGGTSAGTAPQSTIKKEVVVRKKEKKATEGGC
jgi:rhodanese-related sulfurtransferase